MSKLSLEQDPNLIKQKIFNLVNDYCKLAFPESSFVPGESTVPVSGKVFDHHDISSIIESALDGWFTTGRFNKQFEKELAKYIGIRKVFTVNSGSSANLIAFATLTSPELEERTIKPGDELITVAASFPTTVNPAVLYGVVPVFVDVDLPTYNINVNEIEGAITSKTKAIMIAHTLGNPFNLEAVSAIAKKHNLWLIEDCCDALGSTYKGKHVGTFGDISTLSFYPAHHITMGEGGAIFTDNLKLAKILESIRDWGRDCWCETGCDNTCGKRFDWSLGDLPHGYDHKYTYSNLGYNLKITDMQAALGLSQLKKLPEFVRIRKSNFHRLKEGLADLQDKIILPEATEYSDPSWFGLLITLKEDSGIIRKELIEKLSEAKIATRLLFAGDLRKQPYFAKLKFVSKGALKNTDTILHRSFWIGVSPMLREEMIDYMIKKFHEILE